MRNQSVSAYVSDLCLHMWTICNCVLNDLYVGTHTRCMSVIRVRICKWFANVLLHTATHCNTLQHTATHLIRQCVAIVSLADIWCTFVDIWGSFADTEGSVGEIWPSFAAIWRSFADTWRSFADILGSFADTWRSFADIEGSFAHIPIRCNEFFPNGCGTLYFDGNRPRLCNTSLFCAKNRSLAEYIGLFCGYIGLFCGYMYNPPLFRPKKDERASFAQHIALLRNVCCLSLK